MTPAELLSFQWLNCFCNSNGILIKNGERLEDARRRFCNIQAVERFFKNIVNWFQERIHDYIGILMKRARNVQEDTKFWWIKEHVFFLLLLKKITIMSNPSINQFEEAIRIVWRSMVIFRSPIILSLTQYETMTDQQLTLNWKVYRRIGTIMSTMITV